MQKVGNSRCVDALKNANDDVKFEALQENLESTPTATATVTSDFIKNNFDYAYYKCAKIADTADLTKDIQEACHSLANMCVMNMYDDDHDTCDNFEKIKDLRQIDYYDDISNWKEALPWLMYRDAAKTVREDRSIKMQVSFVDMIGFSSKLDFRLAKYTLDGVFVGIEPLSTQFSYCKMASPSTAMGGGDSTSTKFLNFGTSER